MQVIKNYYLRQNAEVGPDRLVEFDTERIHLDIPKKGIATEDDIWKIIPLVFPPQVINVTSTTRIIDHNTVTINVNPILYR